MKVYAQIKKGKYIDSLETLFSSSVLNEQPGVDVGYVGMATASFKDILAEIGLMTEEIDGCGDNDYVIVARAESEEAFRQAAAAVTEDAAAQQGGAEQSNGESFSSVRTAVQAHPEANMCSIAVPGEYALSEVKKEELPEVFGKRIFVYERASQFELLSENPETFMWVSPIPQKLLDRYDLVQIPCEENKKIYKDILIYKRDYKLTVLDKAFIDELCKSKREMF